MNNKKNIDQQQEGLAKAEAQRIRWRDTANIAASERDQALSDIQPLVEAARSILDERVNLVTASYLPDNGVVRRKLDRLEAALSSFQTEKEKSD